MKRPLLSHLQKYLRSKFTLATRSQTSGKKGSAPAGGRGIECLEARIAPAAVVVAGTLHISGDDNGYATDDLITVSLKPGDATKIQVNQNATISEFDIALVNKLSVLGKAGNDSLTLNFQFGNMLDLGGVDYDGGTGRNVLSLLNGTATSDTHTTGLTPGQGTIALTVAGVASVIGYENLAPVNDYLAGPLVVNATNGSNVITYSAGRNDADTVNDPNRARISIDEFVPVQFSNKTTLTLNALGGEDTINLSNSLVPTGLTGISVFGGASGGSRGDKIIINGTSNAETFEFAAVGADSGSILQTNLTLAITQPTVSFDEIEAAEIDGGSDLNDDIVTFRTEAGADTVVLDPGTQFSSGTLTVAANAGSENPVPLGFKNLGEDATLNLLSGAGDRTDTLVYRGTAASDHFSFDTAGRIDLNSQVLVMADGVTNLRLEGGAGGDRFTLAAGSVFAEITVDAGDSPGDRVEIAGTSGNDTVALDFASGMSGGDTVTAGGDTFTLLGAKQLSINTVGGDDAVTVSGLGKATSLESVEVNTEFNTGDSLRVVATDGADEITYLPVSADSGSFTAQAGAHLNFLGVGGTVQLDGKGGADAVLIRGTGGNDAVTASLGAAASTVQVGASKALTLDSATVETLVFELGTGNDTLALSGAGGGALNTLSVLGGSGDDAVTVDFAGGSSLPAGGFSFEGGVGTNSLTLQGGTATADIFTPGAEDGSGTVAITVGTAGAIHFRDVGSLVDLVAGPLTVNGNAAANAIAYTTGSVAARGLVSIDAESTIEFSNKTDLTLNAGGGSDAISLNNPNISTGLTGITINGGNASGDKDTVTIQAQGVAPIVNVTPTGAHSATVTGAGGAPLFVSGAEALHVRGNGTPGSFTVSGSAAPDTFIVTPGASVDSATITAIAAAVTQIPLTIDNMGAESALTLAGGDGTDRIVFNGTDGNDTLLAGSIVSLTSEFGSHVPVTPSGVEFLSMEAGDGSDHLIVLAANSFTAGITVAGGDSSQGDVLRIDGAAGVTESVSIRADGSVPTRQIITGAGSDIRVSGVQLLAYGGSGRDDSLTVVPGLADDQTIRVESGAGLADKVTSATLPQILFGGVNTFTINTDGGSGAQTVTFKTDALAGATPANYRLISGPADMLVVEGSESGDDSFIISKPAIGSVAVVNTSASDSSLTVTEVSGNLAGLKIHGLGGNDTVTVNVEGTALVSVPIAFDGGAGSDALTVSGATTTAVTAQTYAPSGAGEGSLDFTGGAGMAIDFTHLETLTDSVPAASLIVNGNDADNSIRYSGGVVSVDAAQALSFSNKVALTLNGLGGDDTISIGGATALAGLATITVNGGGPGANDHLIIDGTAAANLVTYTPASASAGTVTVANEVIGLPPAAVVPATPVVGPVHTTVNFSGMEKATLNGLAGNDTFKIGAATGNVEIIGGEGVDTVDFSASTTGVTVELDRIGTAQRVTAGDQLVTFGDLVEGFVGTAQHDVIRVTPQPFARAIDGGAEISNPPGDTLVVDALSGVIDVNFTSDDDGLATVFNFAEIAFTDIETTTTVNTAGGVAGGGGTGSVLTANSFTPRVNYPSGKDPRAIQLGDVNGDGFVDMFVTHRAHGRLSVMLGHGDGTFDVPIVSDTNISRPQSVALGDFDLDGDLDAAVTNGRDRTITILQHTGGGTFAVSSTIPVGKAPRNVVTGDVNGDGDLDLAVANHRNHSVSVLLGAGALSFGGATELESGGSQPRDLALVDVDHDNNLDIVVANRGTNTVGVLKGTGTGAFGTASSVKVGNRPLSLVTGDFNQDGDVDIALATGNNQSLKVLLGDGTGSFSRQIQTTTPSDANAQSIGAADFNFDGKLDLVISTRTTNKLLFLLGSNNGTFLAPLQFQLEDVARRAPQGLAIGDLNGDGADDVAVAGLNSDTIAVLLRNV